MDTQKKISVAIAKIITATMERVMENVLVNNPFTTEESLYMQHLYLMRFLKALILKEVLLLLLARCGNN